MKITCKRGRTVTVNQVTTGEVFRYMNTYYMKSCYVNSYSERLYLSADLFTGTIVNDIPKDALVEVFDDVEVFIK